MASVERRLEQYTLKHPQEVLLVTVAIAAETDQILIFKGFSSSLMRPTAFDPDVPILPDSATILSIDRLRGPYNAASPEYLEQGIPWDDMQTRLTDLGL